MYNKYKNKTYTQGTQNEVSDIENESKNIITNNNTTNNTDIEQDKYLKTTFQQKCFFTKQNNNISFYQSTSKDSYRSLQKNKNLSPLSTDKNSVTLKKPPSAPLQIYGEEKFSYNYTAIDKNTTNKSTDKIINSNNERINLNDKLIQKYTKPKRTIKSFKKQYNMEKSDNFNVLSYRPPEYDSDVGLIKNKDKRKKFPIYKKQEVNEIFYPSKRTQSPQINNELIEKYQNQTLKYQSFFGSFNSSKNSHMAKSTSKIKTNQLNDFNIDKLIEIGDRYANQCKPILPLGKFMNNNIIFRTKNRRNKIPFNSKINYNNYSYNNNEDKNNYNYSNYYSKNKNEDLEIFKENSVYLVKEKKRVTKKIISKNNLKNTKTYDENNEIYNKDSTVKKNLNFNTESIDKTDKKLTSSIKLKKKQLKKNYKNYIIHQNTLDKNEEILNYQEIQPIKKNPKRKKYLNLNVNQKENIGINEMETLNYVKNRGEKIKNDTTERKLLTDDEANYRSNNYQTPLEKINNIQNKEIITDNKKFIKDNKIPSNIYYKDSKQKNYYGYDERHNLEDTINNHAYFESVHSKKKINNFSYDKII